jgi:hypothetical protein
LDIIFWATSLFFIQMAFLILGSVVLHYIFLGI